ncbi:MAG: 50S ribosomal protein L11 methyltransferase [Lachnospiraceae bacterium]|nr:50S ribosomal protein L11 methyltransferase [Lachnospiraceae bacterium]
MKWIKYTLKTTTVASDLVIDMMTELGVDGVQIEDNVPISEADKKRMFIDFLPILPIDEGVSYLSFYLEDDSDEERLLSEIKNGLSELTDFVDVGEGTITKSETEDKDWINNWKEFFKSFMVDDIVIKPTWEEMKPEYEGKLLIEIDPGIAFGTGMHETTQLCMRQLMKYVKPDTEILDVGCGSGILSIVSLKLNAKSVVGIDIDVNATTATYENLEVNHIPADKCKVYTGNILENEELQKEIGYDCYDLVVANILADVLVPLTPIVPKHLRKGGLFITSGIIDTKEEEVKQAIIDNGNFEIVEITRQKDWSSITARRI